MAAPSQPAVEGQSAPLRALTPRQIEALRLAHQRGYYRSPKLVRIVDLAAELRISKGAMQQRLASVEKALVDDFMAQMKAADEAAQTEAARRSEKRLGGGR